MTIEVIEVIAVLDPSPASPAPSGTASVRSALRRALDRPAVRSLLFWRSPTDQQAVALTFDDGPHPEFTPPVLEALRDAGARATFFLIGENARRHPELVRRIVAEGHAVGCHTDTHADLSRLGWGAVRRECCRGRETLQALSGRPVRYLRPPWGRFGAATLAVAAMEHMALAMWSVDSLDSRRLTPDQLVERLQQTAPGPGDIVLFHDDGANTAEALPRILRQLSQRKLRCAVLDDLLTRVP